MHFIRKYRQICPIDDWLPELATLVSTCFHKLMIWKSWNKKRLSQFSAKVRKFGRLNGSNPVNSLEIDLFAETSSKSLAS